MSTQPQRPTGRNSTRGARPPADVVELADGLADYVQFADYVAEATRISEEDRTEGNDR